MHRINGAAREAVNHYERNVYEMVLRLETDRKRNRFLKFQAGSRLDQLSETLGTKVRLLFSQRALLSYRAFVSVMFDVPLELK